MEAVRLELGHFGCRGGLAPQGRRMPGSAWCQSRTRRHSRNDRVSVLIQFIVLRTFLGKYREKLNSYTDCPPKPSDRNRCTKRDIEINLDDAHVRKKGEKKKFPSQLKQEKFFTLPLFLPYISYISYIFQFGFLRYGMAKAAVHQLVKSLSEQNSGLPEKSFCAAVLPVTLVREYSWNIFSRKLQRKTISLIEFRFQT